VPQRKQLNYIRESLLGLAKIPDAANAQREGNADTDEKARRPDAALTAEQGPAESVDDAYHGVKRVKQPPPGGNHAAAEADGGNVKAELNDEGDNVTEIAVLDIQRGKPEPHAERRSEGQHDKERKSQQMPIRQEPVKGHHQGHQDQGNGEIHETGDDRSRGHDQARKINLRNQIDVCDETIARFAERIREEIPWQHAGHDQQSIRHRGIGVELGDTAEENREDNHREQRTHDRPYHANYRLFIANENVPPGKEKEQFAKPPQIRPVVLLRTSLLND